MNAIGYYMSAFALSFASARTVYVYLIGVAHGSPQRGRNPPMTNTRSGVDSGQRKDDGYGITTGLSCRQQISVALLPTTSHFVGIVHVDTGHVRSGKCSYVWSGVNVFKLSVLTGCPTMVRILVLLHVRA